MQLNPIATELTTAATDALIAALAAGCAVVLQGWRQRDRWKVAVWSWVFGLLAVAALLGALSHGLMLSDSTQSLLWQPLFLSLGLVVALFVVAAVYDWRGRGTARRAVPVMLVVALLFYAVTQIGNGTFLLFVLYEAAAMLCALAMYVSLAVRRSLTGAGWIAAGIGLNILAAAIQASGSISITIIWPFDHNGVFHLVQIVAIVVLMRGLVNSLQAGRWSG
ncbi:MAG: hypothetical protein JSW43_10675 [Gemmatimonadota bacterium]|nr:MAG: hypothetical protein JSW43_10675 [Gemmatimonadota bacterium]